MHSVMKLLSLISTLAIFAILAALEGGAIGCTQAILLAVPTYTVLIWSLNGSGWLEKEV